MLIQTLLVWSKAHVFRRLDFMLDFVGELEMSVPKYDNLFNPLLKTMKELGSSATVSELDEAVTKRLQYIFV